MEFHISRLAREKYQFDLSMFGYDGNVILADFFSARVFAQKMNRKRDLENFPEHAVRSGQINAMGLIDEIFHHVIALYCQKFDPDIWKKVVIQLEAKLGKAGIDNVLLNFINEFPPISVYRNEISAVNYLSRKMEGRTNREMLIEEMVLLWITNQNPALSPYNELFNDEHLSSISIYDHVIIEIDNILKTKPKFGPDNQSLLDMLLAPAIAVPNSLYGQLEFIRNRWRDLLGQYLYRLLSSLDLVKEEERPLFNTGPGPIRIPVYNSSSLTKDEENFSPDRDWMPRLVLLAKNSYVWLDQLSKKYSSNISRLDQIPEEELQLLSSRGFSGLWLIGLWERSRASARIKQLCGNPDAIASAYSLYSYTIAEDLGGEAAYHDLSQRAGKYGIRLASDMVPNHMAIDSPWVAEHPDWFLSLDQCPYPTHSFDGPNLSDREGLGIFLEDHYFNRTDAAVEFKRVDYRSGDVQYIYHGNDGTSMPWNDTAQLNYLNPAVREAIIQTILEVARRFPIIRFDAAMTLAKKHFQRLWFPEPGSGGAIPTRAEHGLTKDEFEKIMPVEFWREVVDRVAKEVPDTLLLAEAFWLMEGYFVRSLGMHRVYNSAFMHMLRNEDNANYRKAIKDTIEFEPEILKRYVNFMNNPDEKTAAEQFGKGDKYFGICVLMATLPGLPMFGHGQIEGFSEKYGMEFRRAYWDESEDQYLISRHENEIFPILHRRAIFAGVEHFQMYDFLSENHVNEDVFAFSNQDGENRSLVIFHNKFASVNGYIKISTGILHKDKKGRQRFVQQTVAQNLNIIPKKNGFVIFRDLPSSQEFIRSTHDIVENGFQIELGAYQYHVFTDFRIQIDDEWSSYLHLCEYLQGRGVPSIDSALSELLLAPVIHPFQEIFNSGFLGFLLENRLGESRSKINSEIIQEANQKTGAFLKGIQQLLGSKINQELFTAEFQKELEVILALPRMQNFYPLPGSRRYPKVVKELVEPLVAEPEKWMILFGWLFTHNLGILSSSSNPVFQSQSWFSDWQLGRIINAGALGIGVDYESRNRLTSTIHLLIGQQNWFDPKNTLPVSQKVTDWFSDPEIQVFLGFNRWKDVLWFSRDAFSDYIRWMKLIAIIRAIAPKGAGASQLIERILMIDEIFEGIFKLAEQSEYKVTEFLNILK